MKNHKPLTMKSICFFVVVSSFLIASCNNNAADPAKNADSTDIDVTAEKAAIDESKQELEKMIPLSSEELIKVLPEKLLGAEKIDADVSKVNGAGLAAASYAVNDTATIVLNIYDCAGPEGSGIYNMQYKSMLGYEVDNEDEYIKAVTINGQKGFEQCDKTANECIITWFSGNRYLISLRGENTGVEMLKEAANSLKL